MPEEKIRLSVIVPAYNNPGDLRECLTALSASSCPGLEIIVVDDASTDETSLIGGSMGARVMRLARNAGPAAARNYGAREAQGEILFFVDADVAVAPGVLRRVLDAFDQNSDAAAVFGSYDAFPRAQGIVSRYRNLLHHFVHQKGNAEASTFWAGCGAIRRWVFEAVGGFNEQRFPKSSIEDIELGYRLRKAGYRILLDKGLQGTHLKSWTFWSVVWTDIRCRAIPWARLILESRKIHNDLNLEGKHRLSGGLVTLACLLFLLGIFHIDFLFLGITALLSVVLLNRDLYAFFFRQGGLVFAGACVPLHLLYYLYSALSYVCVWIEFRIGNVATRFAQVLHRN